MSALIASRNEGRLTPSCAARSRSDGRRWPGGEVAAQDHLFDDLDRLAGDCVSSDRGELWRSDPFDHLATSTVRRG